MRRLMFHVKHRRCQKNLAQRRTDGSSHAHARLHHRRSFVEPYRVRALSHPCPHRFGWLRRSVVPLLLTQRNRVALRYRRVASLRPWRA
jgi:hypothetical protein